MASQPQFAPTADDPLHKATPAVDDVEARRARAAIEGRLFSGQAKRLAVGRYRLAGRIGAGGMGVVYRAHDPELARDVALKLLNTDAVSDDDAERAHARLVREARAMAQLAHPNVIHVYDVGTVDDGVFIAMELVEGQSMAAWQAEGDHDWRDVLRNYVAAGRGLEAAHQANIIHRDFKPENILVGTDGRVRVGDFGLAGGVGNDPRPAPDASESMRAEVDRGALGNLTRTGTLLGTPKYMAPEQEVGLAATARSDQFSFCVALYEALYGQAPFAGKTVAEYRINVRDENVRPLQPHTKVPSWLGRTLFRGLALDPLERYENMSELLGTLSEALADPKRPRTRRGAGWVAAAGVLAVTAAVFGWMAGRQPSPDEQAPPNTTTSELPVQVALVDPPEPTPNVVKPDVAAPTIPTDETAGSPVEATSADATSAGTGLAQNETEDGAVAATNAVPAVPPKKRKPGKVCFFDEDSSVFLSANKRKRSQFKHRTSCYTNCTTRSAHIAKNASPPEGVRCRKKIFCQRQPSKSCDG